MSAPVTLGSTATAAPIQPMTSSNINLFGIDEHTTYKVVVLAFMAFSVIGAINTMGVFLTVVFSVLLWARGIPFIEHIADIIRSGVPTLQPPVSASESNSADPTERLISTQNAAAGVLRRISGIFVSTPAS